MSKDTSKKQLPPIKKNLLLESAMAEYDAQIKKSITHLAILCQNPVGIGEHTDILEEVDKWLALLADAKDKKDVTESYYDEILKSINYVL